MHNMEIVIRESKMIIRYNSLEIVKKVDNYK